STSRPPALHVKQSGKPGIAVVPMVSPYVSLGGRLKLKAVGRSNEDRLTVSISTNKGPPQLRDDRQRHRRRAELPGRCRLPRPARRDDDSPLPRRPPLDRARPGENPLRTDHEVPREVRDPDERLAGDRLGGGRDGGEEISPQGSVGRLVAPLIRTHVWKVEADNRHATCCNTDIIAFPRQTRASCMDRDLQWSRICGQNHLVGNQYHVQRLVQTRG